jgi:hypothetical protein
MMSKPHTIYGLIDPRNNELYYVGRTRRDPVERSDEHFFESKDTLVSKRNRAILQLGMASGLVKLAEVTQAEAAFHAELYWIHFWAMQGKRLLNREAQPWFVEQYHALLDPKRWEAPQARREVKRPREKKAPGIPALQADTYVKAVQAFPSGNVRALETEWRAWLAGKGQAPDYPDAAFLAFCKKKAARKSV